MTLVCCEPCQLAWGTMHNQHNASLHCTCWRSHSSSLADTWWHSLWSKRRAQGAGCASASIPLWLLMQVSCAEGKDLSKQISRFLHWIPVKSAKHDCHYEHTHWLYFAGSLHQLNGAKKGVFETASTFFHTAALWLYTVLLAVLSCSGHQVLL